MSSSNDLGPEPSALLNQAEVDKDKQIKAEIDSKRLNSKEQEILSLYKLYNSGAPDYEKPKFKTRLDEKDPDGEIRKKLKKLGYIENTSSTAVKSKSKTSMKFEDWFSKNWINLLSVLLLLTGIGFFITWYVMDGSNFHVYETDKTIEKSEKIWIFLYVAISCFSLGSLVLIYRIITDEFYNSINKY